MKDYKTIFIFIMMIVLLSYQGVAKVNAENLQEAYFAGGCFWCMEPPFEKLDGVKAVISGYSGGKEVNPTYEQVSAGKTGHLESVKVEYDADKVDYQTLLNVFWRQIDPTDNGGQFVDRGKQYKSAIFYVGDDQKRLAEASKKLLQESGWFKAPIVTKIEAFSAFYEAEDYHQDYYVKNSFRYKYYRKGSGRDNFLESVWKDEVDDHDEIPKKK